MNSYAQMQAAIQLSRQPSVGAAKFAHLVKTFGSPLNALENFSWDEKHKTKQKNSSQKNKTYFQLPPLNELKQQQISFLYLGHPSYPKKFYQLTEPPPYLFYRGSLNFLTQPILTIVGSRSPSLKGIQLTQELSRQAVKNKYIVASGGATGIDYTAHQTCLEANGISIVFCAHGVDQYYPASHQPLFQKILKTQGCLLSELLPKTPPKASFFPTRNRLLAGIADLVVWIDGTPKSGARYTAKQALKLKKPLFIDYGDEISLQEGPKSFLKHGAKLLSPTLKEPAEFFSNSWSVC